MTNLRRSVLSSRRSAVRKVVRRRIGLETLELEAVAQAIWVDLLGSGQQQIEFVRVQRPQRLVSSLQALVPET